MIEETNMLRHYTIQIKTQSQSKSKDLRGFRRSPDKGNYEQVRIGIQNHKKEQCSDEENSGQFELMQMVN